MNPKRRITILLLLLTVPLLSLQRETSSEVRFDIVPKKSMKNVKLQDGPNGTKCYVIRDLTYRKTSVEMVTDIVFTFNRPSDRLVRDDTKKYTVKYADYSFVKEKGCLGKGCAQFFKSQHRVEVETVRNLWLGSCDDLGSFTLEFRFKPHVVKNNSVLFSRIGRFTGRKRGIEVFFRDGRICAALYGVFHKQGQRSWDVELSRGRQIEKNRWHHFSLSFDRISGKLSKLLDGKEDEVAFMTDSGEPYNGVMQPSFGAVKKSGDLSCKDMPDVVIGKDYSGYLDEFRITYRHFDELDQMTDIAYRKYSEAGAAGRIPYNVEGVITSPVFQFEGTGTRITNFSWKEDLEKNTFIWMEFRISDYKFNPDDIKIKWYRITNNQRNIYNMKRPDGDQLRGKYYQWRAHLVASPEGGRSPRLSGIRAEFQLDLPPLPPQFFEAVEAGDGYVVLRWKKNMEPDIAGYRIYYGIKKGQFDGIISVVKQKPITNGMSEGNYVQLRIDREVIEENRASDRKALLSYPLLKNTVLYYFAVSAYDGYKIGSPYNHESKPCKPVSVRPYAGSEIKLK